MFSYFFPLFRVTVKENSMKPFLKNGDTIVALKYILKKPTVGDVVIFKHTTPPHIFIKRIIKILKGKVWVEGDNKKESIDSRKFGYIKRNQIFGRMVFKI